MRENELFESHLQRTNPHLLDDDEEAAGKGRKKPPKRSQQMLLTAEQKYDIAVQEMEEVREEILHAKQSSEQLMDTLRARMEECDVRIAEIKKDAYEFKRDIVTGAENFRTGKIVAEKAVRYMEDKLRAKAAVAEKLRLKNATLKQQYTKVEVSLQQKEDMGEVLHVIDFDQLKIENQQCAPLLAPDSRQQRPPLLPPPHTLIGSGLLAAVASQVPREDRGSQQRALAAQAHDGQHRAGAEYAQAQAAQPDR